MSEITDLVLELYNKGEDPKELINLLLSSVVVLTRTHSEKEPDFQEYSTSLVTRYSNLLI